MQFELYTERTIGECISAIQERQQSGKFGGKTDKAAGTFTLTVSSKVFFKRFERRTRLFARLSKGDGCTVINGSVPSGISPAQTVLVIGAVLLVGGLFLFRGQALYALLSLVFGALFYIPFTGDYKNSDVLMGELKRTLRTRETPPKKQDVRTAAIRGPIQKRPAAPGKSAATARPAGGKQSPLGAARTGKPATGSKPSARPGAPANKR